jgi:hypothetical protein
MKRPERQKIVELASRLAGREGVDPSWIEYPVWSGVPPGAEGMIEAAAKYRRWAEAVLAGELAPPAWLEREDSARPGRSAADPEARSPVAAGVGARTGVAPAVRSRADGDDSTPGSTPAVRCPFPSLTLPCPLWLEKEGVWMVWTKDGRIKTPNDPFDPPSRSASPSPEKREAVPAGAPPGERGGVSPGDPVGCRKGMGKSPGSAKSGPKPERRDIIELAVVLGRSEFIPPAWFYYPEWAGCSEEHEPILRFAARIKGWAAKILMGEAPPPEWLVREDPARWGRSPALPAPDGPRGPDTLSRAGRALRLRALPLAAAFLLRAAFPSPAARSLPPPGAGPPLPRRWPSGGRRPPDTPARARRSQTPVSLFDN